MTMQAYQPGQPKFHTVHQQTLPSLPPPLPLRTVYSDHPNSSPAILELLLQHYVRIHFEQPLLRPLCTLLNSVIPQCSIPTSVEYPLNQRLPSLRLPHRPRLTLCPFRELNGHLVWMASIHMFVHGWLLHLLHLPGWSLSSSRRQHLTQDSILSMSLLSKLFHPQILCMGSSMKMRLTGSSVPSS